MHGLRFKRVKGELWKYKSRIDSYVAKLKL
jgi:hypothetical protein